MLLHDPLPWAVDHRPTPKQAGDTRWAPSTVSQHLRLIEIPMPQGLDASFSPSRRLSRQKRRRYYMGLLHPASVAETEVEG